MQIQFNGTPVFAGDVDSMVVIFNNLGGANFDDKARWSAYIAMMNSEFFRECPLTPGTRVELLSKGVSYGAFIHSEARIEGLGVDDIARVYQKTQPHRVFTVEADRPIYEEACRLSEEGKPLNNPFCPCTEFQKFQAFAWGQFRVLTGADYLRVRKLHAAARDEQERALYTEICTWSPWDGDEVIGARLKEDLFREPNPFR